MAMTMTYFYTNTFVLLAPPQITTSIHSTTPQHFSETILTEVTLDTVLSQGVEKVPHIDISPMEISPTPKNITLKNSPPIVPFFSQLTDITSPKWQKIGCGIASLAMLIEFYKPGTVEVNTLLEEGISAHAYLDSAGWTYAGLIGVAQKYGIDGSIHDIGDLAMSEAFSELAQAVDEGPVMVSVHYTFDPKNPIPHLVVLNGIKDDKVYYNDPAEKSGGGSISVSTFKDSWKKRYIEFRPLS